MQFLRADAHFRPKTEHIAVGKAGGGVGVNRSSIDSIHKAAHMAVVLADDSLAVSGAIVLICSIASFHIIHPA